MEKDRGPLAVAPFGRTIAKRWVDASEEGYESDGSWSSRRSDQERNCDLSDRGKQLAARRDEFETKLSAQKRRHDAELCKIALFDQWGSEIEARRKREGEEKKRQKKMEEARDEEERREMQEWKRKESAAQNWRDGQRLTQEIITMMRRSGVVPGVNDPPKAVQDPQRETSTQVVLSRRVDNDAGIDGDEEFSGPLWFTVDLKRFRNVEVMKGEKIGPEGANALRAELSRGVCPRLRTLNLGWNSLRLAGTKTLMMAFASKRGAYFILNLDLRANHIPSEGVKEFRTALENDAFPELRSLDLRQNPMGNEGAKVLADCVLAGLLTKLEALTVSSCQIRDSGVQSLFSAFSSQNLPALMPRIRSVIATDNNSSAEFLRHRKTWPGFLRI